MEFLCAALGWAGFWSAVGYKLGEGKGQQTSGAIWCFLFGPLGLIAILLLPDANTSSTVAHDAADYSHAAPPTAAAPSANMQKLMPPPSAPALDTRARIEREERELAEVRKRIEMEERIRAEVRAQIEAEERAKRS
ncbi:MAG: hypothetical protein V4850_36835 [Myxococcota bacterium]